MVLLHISFSIAPELVEFCWWKLSPALVLTAHVPSARRLDSGVALGVRLCQRVGHYVLLVATAVSLDVGQRINYMYEASTTLFFGRTDSVYQTVALGVLVAFCVRLVKPLLALTAWFIFASLSLWRNILNSASAVIFVVVVAKSTQNIRVVLHEALSPLSTSDLAM